MLCVQVLEITSTFSLTKVRVRPYTTLRMSSLAHLSAQEQAAVRQFKAAVEEICGPANCALRCFGSRARHEGHEDSDVDILVLIPTEDLHKKTRIWDAAYAVFSETDVLLSPLVLSRHQYESLKARERLIAQDIERDGIPV